MRVGGPRVGIEDFRKSEEQNGAQKIKNRFLNRGVPALGCGNGVFDYWSIFLAYRPPRRHISSINRKTGDRLSHRPRKRFEGEIAIPAVLLGKPSDHVAQHISLLVQRPSTT